MALCKVAEVEKDVVAVQKVFTVEVSSGVPLSHSLGSKRGEGQSRN